MKLPEDYKKQLRDLLGYIFESGVAFIMQTSRIDMNMRVEPLNGMFVMSVPITFGDTLVGFMREQGLTVKKLAPHTFYITIEV